MPGLGFPLGGPLGGSGSVPPPLLPQPGVDALLYGDASAFGSLASGSTGTDVSVVAPLGGSWPVLGGDAMMAEQIIRRLTTRRGQLDFSPDDGIDLRDELRDDMTAADVFQAKQRLENELLKDERIDDASVVASFTPASGTNPANLQLGITITKGTSSFRLVVAVTDLTLDVLSAEAV